MVGHCYQCISLCNTFSPSSRSRDTLMAAPSCCDTATIVHNWKKRMFGIVKLGVLIKGICPPRLIMGPQSPPKLIASRTTTTDCIFGEDCIKTTLESGHVLMHCRHNLEYCLGCMVDFRDRNDEERRKSVAQISRRAERKSIYLSQKAVKQDLCHWSDCMEPGKSLCSRCRSAGYCCKEHQALDWKQGGHKRENARRVDFPLSSLR